MSKEVFIQVIVPLLGVTGTALICISTPLKSANYCSELVLLTDPRGNKLINLVQINLSCKPCDARKAILGKNHICRHIIARLPPWQSGASHELVKWILQGMGRGGDYDREARGMIRDDEEAAFSKEWVQRLKLRPAYQDQYVPRYIIVTCDFNGGGTASDTALLSAYYHNNVMVICGLESQATSPAQREQLVVDHIRALRNVNRFKQSKLIWVPESNMDGASFHITQRVSKMYNVEVSRDNHGTEGMRTIAGSKEKYTESAKFFLQPENCLYFDKETVCVSQSESQSNRLDTVKAQFSKQLQQWRKVCYYNKTAKQENTVKVTYSGKTDDAGNIVQGQKDDLSIVFIMNAYYQTHVFQRDRRN